MARINVAPAPSGYSLLFENASSLNPADATTYYTGAFSSLGTGTTTAERRVYVPRSGTITAFYIYFLTTGTLGTTETSTMSIRKNDTTDSTVSSSIVLDARSKSFSNAALAISVTAGDYIELKWVTPTWATNPTAVRFSANVFITV